MITIVIYGPPVSWSAHQGYGRRSYNPKMEQRKKYQWQIRPQFNRDKPIGGPIRLKCTYYMKIPIHTSSIRKKQMLNGKIYHIVRPDIDNLNKFLNDSLKEVIFLDDSQIVEMESTKVYGENPKTVVQVEEIE